MEEDEYKSTYKELAPVRCVFEKAITNNHARCQLARHFYLADREGYACNNKECSMLCNEFLEILREKSKFVFKVPNVEGPLPHNREIKVQVGGIKGLLKLVKPADSRMMPGPENINGIIDKVIEKFGSLSDLPYSEIIQSVEQFQGRRRQR
jgi:hypothetical protein